jgi:hypothetical protein
MKSYKLLVVCLTTLSLTVMHPANALFNSECKKPKASYEKYQRQIKKFSLQANQEAAINKTRLNKDIAFCTSDYKSFISTRDKYVKQLIKSKNNCSAIALFDEYRITPGAAYSYRATKDSYQVVLNNQKCFSPELVIEAQRKLGIIK